MSFQRQAQLVQHRVAGFAQIIHFELIGGFDVGTDQHELFDADVIEGLSQIACAVVMVGQPLACSTISTIAFSWASPLSMELAVQ